jgi:hypothetical protein
MTGVEDDLLTNQRLIKTCEAIIQIATLTMTS